MIVGGFSLNKEGLKAKAKIENELQEIDQKIGILAQPQAQGSFGIALANWWKHLLLKNVDFQLLRKIDKSILESVRSSSNFDNSYDSYADFHAFLL